MKNFLSLSLFLSIALHTSCQENQIKENEEFKTYSKGLIYSPQTMAKLEYIVDSLNLKYKTCDLNKTFYAVPQTLGHYFSLKKGDLKSAQKDLENNLPWNDFLKKYPQAKLRKEILILKSQYEDKEKGNIVEFSEVDLNSGYGAEIEVSGNSRFYHTSMKGKWVFQYWSKEFYRGEELEGFYFPQGFSAAPIKHEYARMIGYADCLIDTNVLKMNENATMGDIYMPGDLNTRSKEELSMLLDSMRSTRVVGFCSQDARPREHAMNIAVLSAMTTNWEVFLKAHLDIMNDRFERASDGSYAWAQRKTYIKELEELDIVVPDLIFGTCFRIDNSAKNHYYASIGRVGRALAESKDKKAIKERIVTMIQDKELDDYNRVLMYFLFRNFNHYLEDQVEKKENLVELKNAISAMPNYLKDKIKLEKK